MSTLRYFRDEYMEHIDNHRCPAAVCACNAIETAAELAEVEA